MPLYEYQCDTCQHRFELIQRFSDPPATSCPECGGGVRKLLSTPAIQFKGSGWYITDYARKGANGSGKDAAKPKAAGATDSTSSEKSTSTSSNPAASSGSGSDGTGS